MLRAWRSVTGRRLMGAFCAVLALFGVALAVVLHSQRRIADAEAEVAALDHAKHAGHTAAAQVREQYIHQAHTIIEGNTSHVGHYNEAVDATRKATAHLVQVAKTSDQKRMATEIARLAEASDTTFREELLTALARGDRATVHDVHSQLEALVSRVVALNDELNASLEARSSAALAEATRVQKQTRAVTILCFALAIGLAAVVGVVLMRSILRPISAMHLGVERVRRGDLGGQVDVSGGGELADLARTFNQMTSDLARHQSELVRSQNLASIGHVAAGVAHEINNPLGVILGYLKLLRRDARFSGSDELRILEDEAVQCQRIVQGLLDLARPQKLELGAVDLAELARDAVERLDDSGQLRDITVELPSNGRTVLARADESKLRQVLLNVVVNAAEASHDSGATHIEMTTERRNGEAVFVVCDHGRGIPADVLPRVFDPFFTTKKTGTGLGLAIAQAIVEAHGGRIEIDSSADRGTRVSVRLPAEGV